MVQPTQIESKTKRFLSSGNTNINFQNKMRIRATHYHKLVFLFAQLTQGQDPRNALQMIMNVCVY